MFYYVAAFVLKAEINPLKYFMKLHCWIMCPVMWKIINKSFKEKCRKIPENVEFN
jgi:hypothetical protein